MSIETNDGLSRTATLAEPPALAGSPPATSDRSQEPGAGRSIASGTGRGISWRCILLGLALIPLNAYWVGMVEGVWHGLHMTCLSLAMNAVFLLLGLIIVNVALHRYRPRLVFSQAELLTIFSMLALASILCGHDRLVTLMGVVAHATRYATPENRWSQTFGMYLPDALVIKDPEAAYRFYNGGSAFYSTDDWRHWVMPAIAWTSFWGTLVWMMFCLNTILRRRWTQDERLSYPIVQVPLAMTDPTGGFFRNRLMWIGFTFAAVLDVVNGLNYLFPAVPAFPYMGEPMEVGPLITSRPWNAIGSLRLDVYPFMVGLAFLLPMQLIFSTWFFYVIGKLQLVWGAATGIMESSPLYPYHGLQAAGAIVVLGLVALWEARGYLRQVGRRVVGMRSELDDREEAMSYRTAVVGLLVGAAWVAVFSLWAGLSPGLIFPYFLVFFLVALTVARLRADTGIPGHGLTMVNPQDILVTFQGTYGHPASSLTTMGIFQWFNRFNRAHPMPVGLESLKICHVLRLEQRRMLIALLLTTVFSLICGFVIYPALMYRHGAVLAAELNWTGWVTYGTLQSWLTTPKAPDTMGMGFFGGGGLFALFLAIMRARFVWFPFHPMGYALGIGGTCDRWWFALLVGTVLKGVVIRYGGVRGFTQSAPFFMGLVLGQYVVSCIWSIIAVATETPMYWSWLA
jgi:hypothetical protein